MTVFSPAFMRNATAFGPLGCFDVVLNNLAGMDYQRNRNDSDGTPWRPGSSCLDICKAILCAWKLRDIIHKQLLILRR